MGSLNPYGPNSPWMNPSAQSRMIIPQLPDSTATNQNIMFMLAGGTGGFVIHETNDLIGGMEKIGKEQNEYYVLGYTPPDSEEGSCHTLRVKVERGGHRSARAHRLLQFAGPRICWPVTPPRRIWRLAPPWRRLEMSALPCSFRTSTPLQTWRA